MDNKQLRKAVINNLILNKLNDIQYKNEIKKMKTKGFLDNIGLNIDITKKYKLTKKELQYINLVLDKRINNINLDKLLTKKKLDFLIL